MAAGIKTGKQMEDGKISQKCDFETVEDASSVLVHDITGCCMPQTLEISHHLRASQSDKMLQVCNEFCCEPIQNIPKRYLPMMRKSFQNDGFCMSLMCSNHESLKLPAALKNPRGPYLEFPWTPTNPCGNDGLCTGDRLSGLRDRSPISCLG